MTNGDLASLDAGGVAAAVAAGQLDPVEVIERHVNALGSLTPLNAIITECGEQAIERARGGLSGPLAGVPLIVKDLFDTAGVRTTYGSRIYADHVPTRSARAVTLLEEAGAVVIAKSNLHEFAWGTTSQNPHFGYVGNPIRPGCVAGGSSGGNAAALAAGVGLLALGTDTGGSIRIPAACCGIAGFKPPHGVVPSEGCFPLSPSLDVAGPMARTVADCALAYSLLGGDSIPEPRIEGLVAGVLDLPPSMSPHEPGLVADGGGTGISDAVARLDSLGARLETATLDPPAVDLVPVMLGEAAAGHRETFPSRRDEYGPDTQLKWDAALAVPEAAVQAAHRELQLWRARMLAAAGPDIYVTPTLAGPTPELDVWEPDVRLQMIGYTRMFSFLGWPAIAIGGLQIAGRDASTVLAAALAWERAA